MRSADIVREHLDKPRYTEMPSLTLAKVLVTKHPGQWSSLDAARTMIRRARGQAGNLRKRFATHQRGAGSVSDGNDYFPKPVWKEMKHHYLRGKRILVISDLHIPYHDIKAVDAAFADAIAWGVDSVCILGDWWDFHQAQDSFDRERGAASVPQEIEIGKEALTFLRQKFKRCELTFVRGNHDQRLDKFIFRRAEQLWGIPGLCFEELTGIRSLGFSLVEEDAKVFAGKLILLHGHEIIKGKGTVNAARTFFLQALVSGMIGHCHQTSHHCETSLAGKMISCWSLGCLCYLHPRYRVYNSKWNHGHALVEIDKDGSYLVHNRRIYKGKAW